MKIETLKSKMFTWPYHHSHLDNDQVRRILQLPPSSTGLTVEPAVKELQEALTAYLRRATETFDLSKNVEVSSLSLCVPSFLGDGIVHLGVMEGLEDRGN